MLYCPLCQVKVAGNKRCCPLCKGQLTGTPEPESEIFPQLVPPHKLARIARRMITLCLLVVVLGCIQVESVWHPASNWPLIVIAAVGCLWLSVMLGISRRRVLMQNLTAQAILFSMLAILWDHGTGWRGWSIEWVNPILCLSALGALLLLKIILRVPMVEAVAWLGTLSVLGWLIPLFLLLFGEMRVVWPNVLCCGLSFVVAVVLIIFFHRYMREEAERRFHL